MRRVNPPRAGFSRVTALKTALVWESEQGFCVKAVRKPAGYITFLPVWESLQGVRPAGQNIRTVADWSSSQNNNNNAWIQNFSDGRQNDNNKNNTNRVRAVRGFTQTQKEGETLSGFARKYIISGQPFLFGNLYAA
jgi:hypothetical protein